MRLEKNQTRRGWLFGDLVSSKTLAELKENVAYDEGWTAYMAKSVSNPYSRGSEDWNNYEEGVTDATKWSSRFESDRTGYIS